MNIIKVTRRSKTSTITFTISITRKPAKEAVSCPECGFVMGHLSRCPLR